MKILVAIDPSESAAKALDKAIAMAVQDQAELTILSVGEDLHGASESYLAPVRDKLVAEARKAAEAAQARAQAAGVKAHTLVESCFTPVECIVAEAARGYGLLVLGHRIRSGLDKLLIGSVAAKVVENAPCSVLVVV